MELVSFGNFSVWIIGDQYMGWSFITCSVYSACVVV